MERNMREICNRMKQDERYRGADIYPALNVARDVPTVVVIIRDKLRPSGPLEKRIEDETEISIFNYGQRRTKNETEMLDSGPGIQEDTDEKNEDMKDIDEVINKHCKSLYFKHSNLESIISSKVKTTSNGAIINHTACIVFLCKMKGYIPLGEDEFPREIEGIPTDVRDGLVIPSGCDEFNDPLGMGCRVGKKGLTNWCSVGIFTKNSDGKVGFISTAHTFIRKDKSTIDSSLLADSGRLTNTNKIAVVQPPNSEGNLDDLTNACGYVDTGHGWYGSLDIDSPLFGQQEVGVDLAFVTLTNRFPRQSITTPVVDDNLKNHVGELNIN